MPAIPRLRREVTTRAGLRETFLHPAVGLCTTSASDAVAASLSILELQGVASSAEVELLRSATQQAAERQHFENAPGRYRLPILEHFDDDVVSLCDVLMRRVLRALEADLPLLHDALFGSWLDDIGEEKPLVHHPCVLFSRYEPALSLYRAGGSFEPHQDGESLTILIPLSEADESFSGGGTAFWAPPTLARGEEAPRDEEEDSEEEEAAEDELGPRFGVISRPGKQAPAGADTPHRYWVTDPHSLEDGERVEAEEPEAVVRPPAGTAIIFGGSVTHAARPVREGERCVFVASFSLLGDTSEEDEGED